jgi:hypothetical protein
MVAMHRVFLVLTTTTVVRRFCGLTVSGWPVRIRSSSLQASLLSSVAAISWNASCVRHDFVSVVWTGPKGQKYNVFDIQTKMFPDVIRNSVQLTIDDMGTGALVAAPHAARRAENRANIDLFDPRKNKWINVWNQVLSGTSTTFAGFTTEFPMQDISGIRFRIDPLGDTTAWQSWEGVVLYFGTLSDGLCVLYLSFLL